MPWPGNAVWELDREARHAAEPDLVVTPWGQEWRRQSTGLYLPDVPVRPLSLGALLDVMASWRTRSNDAFTQTPRGRLYALAGDRIVFLWRHPGTDRWSVGHLAAYGERDGVWVARERGQWLALDTALGYLRRHRDELPVQITHAQVCARLDTRDR